MRSLGILAAVLTVLVSCTDQAPHGDGDLSTSSAALCVTDPLQYALGYEPPVNGVAKAGWFNVQTDCQGLSVTSCVQQRLDQLNFNKPYAQLSPVIYFPDAVAPYLITQPLNIRGIHGVTLVGQSPTGTVLKWSGGARTGCDITSASPSGDSTICGSGPRRAVPTKATSRCASRGLVRELRT